MPVYSPAKQERTQPGLNKSFKHKAAEQREPAWTVRPQTAGSYLTSPAVPRRGKRTRSEQRGRLPRRQRPRRMQQNLENPVKPKGRLPMVRLPTVPAGISPRIKKEPRH